MGDRQALKPCPFCGSTDLRADDLMYWDDDGERPGVECVECDATARAEWWNQREGEGLPDSIIQALNSGDGVYRP